jgi:adenylate cyclase
MEAVWSWLKRRALVHGVIVALFVVPTIILLFSGLDQWSPALGWVKDKFQSLEYMSIDDRISYGRKTAINPEIVFLAIDAASVSLDSLDPQTVAASRPLTLMASHYPFPREVYGLVCDRLFAAGARVVAFDLLFPAPSPKDPPWKAAIDQYGDKLVIAMNFSDEREDPSMERTKPSRMLSLPSASLFPDQDPFDPRLAYVNFWPDPDDVVREAQYRTNLDNLNGHQGADKLPKLYSLAARVVQKAGYDSLIPDDLAPRTMRFAGQPTISFTNHPLYSIFDPHFWELNFKNGDYFRDKIVVVGPQGDWAKDIIDTPWGPMNGVEVHLNAINDLLENDFLHPASDWLIFVLIAGFGGIAYLLDMTIISIVWRFVALLAVLGGYTLALMAAYNGPGWLLPAVGPMGVLTGATSLGFIYDFTLTQIEKLRLRTTFERYNSKNVVKYLLENTDTYEEMLAGTRRPVTVLFSDIRGFTTIAEEAPDSHRLVAKLNEYLTAMVECVFRYDGSLDSFMGDGIMACWGNTPYNFGPKEDAIRAVRAALAMLVELKKLNERWLAGGGEAWKIGIGLNHGPVIVGDIGSQQHKEFAAIGDAVNLGSRIEGLTKEYRLQILMGQSVAELVADTFHLRSVDIVQVKGKSRAVETYTVLGEKSEPLAPAREKFLALHEQAIRAFRTRDFGQAKGLWIEALQIERDDYLAAQYLASCIEFIDDPPDLSWTGVRVMTKK